MYLARLELALAGVGVQYFIQLSYRYEIVELYYTTFYHLFDLSCE